MIDALPFPVAGIDARGAVHWANSAWREMATAHRPGDGRAGNDLAAACGFTGDLDPALAEIVVDAATGGNGGTIELDVPNLGVHRWARLSVVPLPGTHNGQGDALISVVPLRRLYERDGDGFDYDAFVDTFEHLSQGVVLLDAAMQVRVAAGSSTNFLGVPGYAHEGRAALDLIHPDDQLRAITAMRDVLAHPGDQVDIDLRLLLADGTSRWTQVVATNLLDHPLVRGVLVMLRDISARKDAELLAAHLTELFDVSPDIVVLFDQAGSPLYCNPAAIEAAGERANDPATRTEALRDLISRLSRDLPAPLGIVASEPWEGEVTLSIGGETRTYSVVVLAAHQGNRPDFFACVGREITDRKRLEAQLAHRALHDPLTGLPNRAALLDRLARKLREQPAGDTHLGVMFLDLDNMKDVNDSLGHEIGDRLLEIVSHRLRAATRPGDVVSRLGGDEFVVLCSGLPSAGRAIEIAERIRAAVTGNIAVGAHDVFVSASIGVAVVPPRWQGSATASDDALRLLRDADTAMYDAKQHGRARVVLFAEEMHARVANRLQLTSGLHQAVSDGRLELLYQPVGAIDSGELVGFEALLRWNHPDLGVLTPDQFVELAEESGLIVEIGQWAMHRAAADIAAWRRDLPGAERLSVNVNVSGRQLLDPGFVDHVTSILEENALGPDALVLEVTESTLVRDASTGTNNLKALRALGIRLALDDFGTGYSALSYLRQFAVDQIKLDGSFVTDIDRSAASAAITRAVIEMSHALGSVVVAESVADESQLAVLRSLGCDRAQGYLLGHPTPAAEIPALVAARLGIRS